MAHQVGIWIDHKKHYEGRYDQHLDRYFDEVIRQVGQPESLLIFGPGEAKLQLKARLNRSRTLPDRIVGIETTDKMTDPQIAAKVKKHYGIRHRGFRRADVDATAREGDLP